MQISTMRIDELDKLHIKKIGEKKLPEFSPGDTLKVNVRIIEGKDKEYKLTKEFVLLKKIEELILLLQLEKFLLVKVLKDYFQFIVQT